MPMAQPDIRAVHFSRPLANVSIAFQQDDDRFVAGKVFATLPVAHKSDRYYVYPKEYWYRDEAEKRAPGAESAGVGYELTTEDFNCDVWSLHRDVADQIADNASAPIQLEREAVLLLTQKMMIRRDREWAANFFVPGVWGNDYDVPTDSISTVAWSAAGGTPIQDIRGEQYRILGETGQWPNVLTLGANVWRVIQDNLDFLGRVTGGANTESPAKVMRRHLADLLELDEVLVASSVFDSSIEGAASSVGFIHGDSALLVHRPASAGLYTPAAGYNFAWTGMRGAGGTDTRIKRFRLERNEAVRIEAQMAFDQKLVSPELGSLFINAV